MFNKLWGREKNQYGTVAFITASASIMHQNMGQRSILALQRNPVENLSDLSRSICPESRVRKRPAEGMLIHLDHSEMAVLLPSSH